MTTQGRGERGESVEMETSLHTGWENKSSSAPGQCINHFPTRVQKTTSGSGQGENFPSRGKAAHSDEAGSSVQRPQRAGRHKCSGRVIIIIHLLRFVKYKMLGR